MTDTISQLVHLSRSMQSLAAASALLAGVPESMRALHEEFTAAKAELDALDASATQAALERRQAEAAIADAQEKLKHFQQQVSKVRNQREYGALLTEIIFSYPGMGLIMRTAASAGDYNVLYGAIAISIIAVATAGLVIDLIYPLLDPRIRHR